MRRVKKVKIFVSILCFCASANSIGMNKPPALQRKIGVHNEKIEGFRIRNSDASFKKAHDDGGSAIACLFMTQLCMTIAAACDALRCGSCCVNTTIGISCIFCGTACVYGASACAECERWKHLRNNED